MDDPIFSLTYETSLVRYEQVPSWLEKRCRLGGDHSWIYAHASGEGSDYYIVMSYNSGADGDSFGNSLWVKGTECKVDESKWTLSGTPPTGGYRQSHSWQGLPGHDAPKCGIAGRGEYCYVLRSPSEEAVLRALAQDALQRAVKAFGRAQFKKKECSAAAISEQADYPIIQQELRKFCSTPD